MKRLTQIFQALLGVVALIFTAIIAFGRLAWRTIRNWWKCRPKWLRRATKALLCAFFLGFIANAAINYYDATFGRDYYWDEDLSDQVSLHSFADDTWRVYNRFTEEYTTDKLNWVSKSVCDDSLTVYALPNRRGYLDVRTGQIVIDAEENDYRKAWLFSEGLAAVMMGDKIGFINANNEVVIPFQFEYADKSHVGDFGYVFHNGYCVMTNAEGFVGLIDREGNWAVEPTYDNISAPYAEGYRVVVKNAKCGVLNAECGETYSTEYDHINIISEGIELIKDGRMWQVNFEGEIVHPFMFGYSSYLRYPIGYDECGEILYAFADYAKYEVMNRYGIMNRITGEPITPAIYSDVNMLSADLFEVQYPESYDWSLLDAKSPKIK